MANHLFRKKAGFHGQKAIVIPRQIIHNRCESDPLVKALYATDIGYYPNAKYHFRQRNQGAAQHILIFCAEGIGTVTMGYSTFLLKAGQFIIIPKSIPHSYSANEQQPWSIYWMHFSGAQATPLLNTINETFGGLYGTVKQKDKCLDLFGELYGQLERGYHIHHLRYAHLCLWHFFAAIIYQNAGCLPAETDHDVADHAISFMQHHITQSLSVAQIAAEVHLSVPHFSFLFKKKTGFPPIDYFNHLKVQQACQYLLFTNHLIKEIALELGFADQYYFSRMFSKVMGMSPNDYRERRIQ